MADLNSTNGTFVNDDVVREQRLRDGDQVRIGRSILKFMTGENIEVHYHEEIYRLMTVDGLTQIYNRRYFNEALEREFNRSKRYDRALSLIVFDIDHFKRVNDTHGHLAGDNLLRQIATAVKPRLRREDIFARTGGEEFGILVPEIALDGARITAEKVRRIVETHAAQGRPAGRPGAPSASAARCSASRTRRRRTCTSAPTSASTRRSRADATASRGELGGPLAVSTWPTVLRPLDFTPAGPSGVSGGHVVKAAGRSRRVAWHGLRHGFAPPGLGVSGDMWSGGDVPALVGTPELGAAQMEARDLLRAAARRDGRALLDPEAHRFLLVGREVRGGRAGAGAGIDRVGHLAPLT